MFELYIEKKGCFCQKKRNNDLFKICPQKLFENKLTTVGQNVSRFEKSILGTILNQKNMPISERIEIKLNYFIFINIFSNIGFVRNWYISSKILLNFNFLKKLVYFV